MKQRLDQMLVRRGLVTTRSQAESFIKLRQVSVNGVSVVKPGFLVDPTDVIKVIAQEQYVSRAGLKLASVASTMKLDFKDKTVLDVGSSTGGFTDYALRGGAHKVIAVDVGTNQLHPGLQGHPRIKLHEKTDIRDFTTDINIEIVLIDVSFVSLRAILPYISKLASKQTQIVAMVKPQFEAGQDGLKHKGVIKNEKIRRDILKSFEGWAKKYFIIRDKVDSAVSGAKGNHERFYLLRKL